MLREVADKFLPSEISKGLEIDAPNVLLPYQGSAIATCINNDYDVVFIEKSRRVGITWGLASEAVLTASSSKKDGGQDVLYVGTSIDMAREFIDVCADWARAFSGAIDEMGDFEELDGTVLPKGWVFDDDKKDVQVLRIQFASGFKVIAITSKPRSLRGRQGWVIIDEAAFHDDLKELMKAALALLMWGGRVTVISTHDGEDNPFNEYIKQIKAGRIDYGHVKITFDTAIKDGLYERISLIKGKTYNKELEQKWVDKIRNQYGDGANEELDCVPSQGSGAVFAESTIEKAMLYDGTIIRLDKPSSFVDVSEAARKMVIQTWLNDKVKPILSELPKKGEYYFGMDFARNGDLSALWIINKGQDLIRKTPLVMELRNIPYEQQKQILFYIIDNLPRFMRGKLDATGNGGYLAEVARQRYGASRIEEVKLTNKWYEENMPKFEVDFKDGLSLIPKDLDILNDHRAVKRVKGIVKVPRDERQVQSGADKTKKRHGDTAIAHALAYIATTDTIVPIEYEKIETITGEYESWVSSGDIGGYF